MKVLQKKVVTNRLTDLPKDNTVLDFGLTEKVIHRGATARLFKI